MIALSDHFTLDRLLRFTVPSVMMMIFTSVYCVADGFFVSNFAGKAAFTALNFIIPFPLMLGSAGYLFGTGGSALIAKVLGARDRELADRIFSSVVYVAIGAGLLLTVGGLLVLRPLAVALGARDQLLHNSLIYGSIYILGLPTYILQYAFQCLFAAAGKPRLGLYVTLAAGLANILLDALFVAAFYWGLAGAAWATVLSQCIGGFLPLLYFGRPNSSLLRLVRTPILWRSMARVCINGCSELLTNVSMSVVGMIFNIQLLHYAGEDGVAAYGVLMYLNLIFLSVFMGYSVGSAPLVSFHYGADNRDEVKNILRKSLLIIGASSLFMFLSAELLAEPLSRIYVGYDQALMDMTRRAFLIYSVSFLFAGFSIQGSAFFTALNDGLTSAVISALRTLVLQIAAVLILPLLWGIDGIWLSIVAAEFLAAGVALLLILARCRRLNP